MAKLIGNKNNQMVTLGAETPSVNPLSTAISQIKTQQQTASAPAVGNQTTSSGADAITKAISAQAEILKKRAEELAAQQAALDARLAELQAGGGSYTADQLAIEQDRLNDRKTNLAADQYEYQQRAAEYGEILSAIPYQEIEAAAKESGARLTGGTKAILDTMRQRVEQMREKQRRVDAKRDELAMRVEDFRNGVGEDTAEDLNREIAGLTLMERNLVSSRTKNNQDASALAEATAQGAGKQIQEKLLQDAYDSYYTQSDMEAKYQSEKDALYAEWQSLNKSELETGIYGDRTASDVWEDIQRLEDEYQGYLVEADTYWETRELEQLTYAERKLVESYVTANRNKGTSVDGKYYSIDDVNRLWDQMVRTYGGERARELAQLGERAYDAKTQAEENERLKNYAQKSAGNAIIASAASIVTNFASAPGALVEIVRQKLNNPAGLSTLNVNAPGFEAQNVTRSIRGGVQEAIMPDAENATFWNKAGSMLYGTVMSGIDSLVASVTLGGAAGAVLGATAATNAAQDITERGGTMNQAILGGVAAGAFEMVFENVSLGQLDALKEKDTVRTIKDYLINVAKSVGTNASEEAATEMANILFDIVALGNASDYEQQLRALMAENPGMSEAEAKRELAGALALQVVESAVSGALMGGMFGVLGSTQAAKNTKTKDAFYNSFVLPGLIDQGLTYQGSAAFDMAADLQVRINEGQTIPHEEVTALAEQMQKLTEQKREQGAGIAESTNAYTVEEILEIPQQVEKLEENIRALPAPSEQVQEMQTEAPAGEDIKTRTTEEQTEQEETTQETTEPTPQQAEPEETTEGNIPARGEAENVAQGITEKNTVRREAEETVQAVMAEYPAAVQEARIAAVVETLRQTGDEATADEVLKVWREVGGENVVAYREMGTSETVTEDRGGVDYGRTETASDGGGERDAGAYTGGSSGVLGTGAEGRKKRSAQNKRAAQRQTRVHDLRTKRVSTLSLGIDIGSDLETVTVVPEEAWDGEMQATAERVWEDAGLEVQYILGKMRLETNAGTRFAKGAIVGGKIIIQADNLRYTVDQIADHEIFHDLARGNRGLVYAIREAIQERYTREEYEKIVERYLEAYAGVYENDEELLQKIAEEIFADAYAGINEFSERVPAVRRVVREITDRRTGRMGDRGTSETRAGPDGMKNAPADAEAERFAISDSFEKNSELIEKGALPRKENPFVYISQNTPEILQEYANAENLPVIISYESLYLAVRKNGVLKGHYHDLGAPGVAEIVSKMNDPVLILRLENGRINEILSLYDKKGKQILVSVELSAVKDFDRKNQAYNLVMTMFGAGENYLNNLQSNPKNVVLYNKTEAEETTQVNPRLNELSGTVNAESSTSTYSIDSGNDSVNTRFSLDAPVEETDTLIALHNVSEENLRKSLDLGAFPAPSIAVVKAKKGHEAFGEISVVFTKDTIDPELDERNAIYGEDAWTPIVERNKSYKKGEAERAVGDMFRNGERRIDIPREVVAQRYESIQDVKDNEWRLDKRSKRNMGKRIEDLYDIRRTMSIDRKEEKRRYHEEFEKAFKEWKRVDEERKRLLEEQGKIFDKRKEIFEERRKLFDENDKKWEEKRAIREAREKIFFTPWRMTKKDITLAIKKTPTIAPIADLNLPEVEDLVLPEYPELPKRPEDLYDVDIGWVREDETLRKAIKARSFEEVKRIFVENGYRYSDSSAKKFFETLQEARNAGARYFEAKPARVVEFDEVAAVVAPETISIDTKNKLREAGISVVFYNEYDEEDRIEKLNSIENVRFAMDDEPSLDSPSAEAVRIWEELRGTYGTGAILDGVVNGRIQELREKGETETATVLNRIWRTAEETVAPATEYDDRGERWTGEVRTIGEAEERLWTEVDEDRLRKAREQAKAEREERLRLVTRENFTATPAVEKLGVRIEGSVADYGKAESLRRNDAAAKETRRQIDRAERRLNPTAKEKEFASGLAAGVYDLEDIPRTMRQERIVELADLYSEARSLGLDMIKERRREINGQLDEVMQELFHDSEQYKPMTAMQLYHNTPQRIMQKIFGDKLGDRINREIFDPVARNEAERLRFMNHQFDRVRTFRDSKGRLRGLSRAESALTQQIIEGRAVAEQVAALEMKGAIEDAAEQLRKGGVIGEIMEKFGLGIGDGKTVERYARWLDAQEAMKSGKVDAVKVENAADEYRKIFDEYYEAINDFLVVHGYEPIGFIKGYAPHMQSDESKELLEKALKTLGIQTEVAALPTTIAGLTSEYKPGKRWNPYFLSRHTDQTDYDIESAFESYVNYMSDVLYHTDDIMRVRRMSRYFRKSYSPEEIKGNIDWAESLRYAPTEEKMAFLRDVKKIGYGTVLSAEEAEQMMEAFIEGEFQKITENTKFGDLVSWLDNYANILAGKQSVADRGFEAQYGRKLLNWGRRVSAMFSRANVAGNISSALNQSAQLPQIVAENGTINTLKAIGDIVSGKVRKAGFAEESDFLTGKRGVGFLVTKPGEMVTTALFKPAEFVDGMISTMAVRGAYHKAVRQGMSHEEAMRKADRTGQSIMASRVKGVKPMAFESKNFLAQMVNMFQVEALNSWQHLAQDLPRDFRDIAETKGRGKAAMALSGVVVKTLLGAFLMNRMTDELYGGTPAPFDLAGMSANFIASGEGLVVNELLRMLIDNVWEDLFGERPFETERRDPEDRPEFDWDAALQDLWYEVSNEIPYLSNLSGLLGWGDQTLPLPDVYGNVENLITAIKNAGWVSAETGEAVIKLIGEFLPGGRQMTKTAQGVKVMLEGGRYYGYGDNRRLQYPVDGDAENWIKAVLFGYSSLSETNSFYASGVSGLSAKQTKVYEELTGTGYDKDVLYETLLAYNAAEDSKGERAAITAADLTDRQKLNLYTKLKGDSREEEFDRLMNVGLSWAETMEAYDEYSDLYNTEGMNATEKATRYAKWVDEQGYEPEQAALIKDELKFFNMAPAEAGNYEKFSAAGLSIKESFDLATTFAELEPEEGKDQVSDMQKYRAIVASGMDENEQLKAIGAIMGTDMLTESGEPSQYAKMLEILDDGTTITEYLDLKDADQVDAYLKAKEKGIELNTYVELSKARQIDNYLDAVELGLSKDSAYKVVMAVAALPELPEGESYDTSDRQAAAVAACDTVEEQIIAYAAYGNANSAKTNTAKFTAAAEYDVSPAMYLEARAFVKANYNANGNGSLDQKEVEAGLRAMDLTNKQRAALFQLFGSKWKKNPFGDTTSIRDAYEAAQD